MWILVASWFGRELGVALTEIGVAAGVDLVLRFPDLGREYLVATTALAAWLARDWRLKFSVLMGFKPPEALNDRAA